VPRNLKIPDIAATSRSRGNPEQPHLMMNNSGTEPSRFPSLPIVSPDVPRRTQREKYGATLYLGLAGLLIILALVGWFGYRFWTMRDVWARVYVLHDAKASEEARLQAAFALSRDPRVEPRQLWEMSLRRNLPDLARYILADGIGTALVAEDAQGYVSAVALSPDWPSWLRLVLARPMAYAATAGHTISRETLSELCRQDDKITRLWALYALAVQSNPDPQTVVMLEKASSEGGPLKELADLFLSALRADESRRPEILDRATAWNRAHHPEAARVWQGWAVQGGKLVRVPAA
jgi:hypothetical protein